MVRASASKVEGRGFESFNSRGNNRRNAVIFILRLFASSFPFSFSLSSIAYGGVLCVERFALFVFVGIVKIKSHSQIIFIAAIVASRNISITSTLPGGFPVRKVGHVPRSVFRITFSAGSERRMESTVASVGGRSGTRIRGGFRYIWITLMATGAIIARRTCGYCVPTAMRSRRRMERRTGEMAALLLCRKRRPETIYLSTSMRHPGCVPRKAHRGA